MKRQAIKNLIFISYNFVWVALVYMAFKNIGIWAILASVYTIISLSFTSKFKDGVKSGLIEMEFVFFYPKLHKRVVHESGEYYIYYDNKNEYYVVYKDNILYKKTLFRFDASYMNRTEDILHRVKVELDSIYNEEMKVVNKIKNRKMILEKWDGYTSKVTRRDDKIDQVIQ